VLDNKTIDECLIVDACHSHAIGLDGWEDGTLFLTIWSPAIAKQWGRFRWAWLALRHAWHDNEVCLDDETVDKLQTALVKHIQMRNEARRKLQA